MPLYRFYKLLCFIICFSAAGWFCRKQTDGFTILKISSDLPYHAEWEMPPLNDQDKEMVSEILDQPYSYLARGDQCFVFVSQDQKYVLKFFRQNRMRAPFWAGNDQSQKIASKLDSDFASYMIAYKELKEETGLVYLHLNKTQDLRSTLTLIDKIGIAHSIPLDTMEFLVQRRAQLLYSTLEECIRKGEIDAAKSTLTNLVCHLMKMRYEKGISDTDPDLNTNFGCIGTIPVQIDIGRFKHSAVKRTREDCRKEIMKVTDNLHQWLECRSRELDDHLKLCLVQENA